MVKRAVYAKLIFHVVNPINVYHLCSNYRTKIKFQIWIWSTSMSLADLISLQSTQPSANYVVLDLTLVPMSLIYNMMNSSGPRIEP